MKLVYRDLAHPDLLRKCLHGGTQNSNESFNIVVWTKDIFVGKSVLQLGCYDSVLVFNDGERSKLNVFSKLGISPGTNLAEAVNQIDKIRIEKAEMKQLQTKKRKMEYGDDDEEYSAGPF